MVAELASISASCVERKGRVPLISSTPNSPPSNWKPKKRPKWIQTATREPIYSVLDCNETKISNIPPGLRKNVVVISAVSQTVRSSKLPSDSQRELPYVWVPPENKPPALEVDDENALYSVVRKPKKVKLPEEGATIDRKQKSARQEEETGRGEKEIQPVISRQEELRRWLQVASEQLPGLGRSFDLEMYTDDQQGDQDRSRGVALDWNRTVAMPRGIVGLVGPYRVYQNPNERREYMLQEEELVEEVVDSVSEVAAPELQHRRAKWRIRDDDEETLVPEIRSSDDYRIGTMVKEDEKIMGRSGRDEDVNGEEEDEEEEEEEGVEEVEEKVQWKEKNDAVAYGRKIVEKEDFTGTVEGVLSGNEERGVDVPDGESAVSITARKMKRGSNEQQDKDSLNETGSTTGGNVEGAPGGAPSRGERSADGDSAPVHIASSIPPSRSLVSRILARARSPDDLLDHSEPFSQLWVVLSNVYGELVVVIMMALCFAEVMDTPVPLLSLQGVFLMYLYVGSIAVIISIYIWVLVDSCGSLSGGRGGLDDAELGGASLTRFGSLKRAHISRARTAPTSFYIRVGALLFGLATLVFNGLEMAMHSMMQGVECLNDVVFVHPVLHGLFTFLQMHFLFVNSQVLVERFGLAARFGFTHLAATNIAVWVRLVIWDSALEWTYFVHLAQRGSLTSSSPLNLRGFPGSLTRHARDLLGEDSSEEVIYTPYRPISNEQISQVIALQECVNTNTLGQLWTSSMPFLYPFIVQFSLIAAAVTFVMGQNVGRSRLSHKQKFHGTKDLTSHTRVGCDGSSKGLFLGILCMVAGIVVILIFLVVREDENFPSATLSWLTCGTLIGILTLSGLMTASGLVQVRQMSVVSRAPAALDNLLSNVALFGVQLYSVFTIVVCTCSLVLLDEEAVDTRSRHIMLLSASILQLVQCYGQSTLIAEASKRSCITRFQMMAKPGRQVITFLLFSNAVLWAFDTVVTQNWISQELQLRFFGVLAWGVLSRIGLPLLIFYRFHSCVLLLEAWNKCYRTPRGEHPLN